MGFHFSTQTAMFQHAPPVLFQSHVSRGDKEFLEILRPFTFYSPISNSHLTDLDHPCMRMTIASSPTRA